MRSRRSSRVRSCTEGASYSPDPKSSLAVPHSPVLGSIHRGQRTRSRGSRIRGRGIRSWSQSVPEPLQMSQGHRGRGHAGKTSSRGARLRSDPTSSPSPVRRLRDSSSDSKASSTNQFPQSRQRSVVKHHASRAQDKRAISVGQTNPVRLKSATPSQSPVAKVKPGMAKQSPVARLTTRSPSQTGAAHQKSSNPDLSRAAKVKPHSGTISSPVRGEPRDEEGQPGVRLKGNPVTQRTFALSATEAKVNPASQGTVEEITAKKVGEPPVGAKGFAAQGKGRPNTIRGRHGGERRSRLDHPASISKTQVLFTVLYRFFYPTYFKIVFTFLSSRLEDSLGHKTTTRSLFLS